MKWYVKYGYSDSDEGEMSLQTLYTGESHFIAWIVYKWCVLFYMKGVRNTVAMYNGTASDPTLKAVGIEIEE